MFKRKKHKVLNIFFTLSLLFFTDIAFTKEQSYKDQFQKIVLDYRYILGPGDILKVSVLNIEKMQYQIVLILFLRNYTKIILMKIQKKLKIFLIK